MTATTMVIEWAPFTLVKGTAEGTLLQASESLQREFLSQQRGFVRRELLKGNGNQWVDLVYWASLSDAEGAAQNIANSPACHRYFQLMEAANPNDPAAGVLHFGLMRTYPAQVAEVMA